MSFTGEKTRGDDTQKHKPKIGASFLLISIIIAIIILFILNTGSFLFVQITKGKSSQPAINAQTPTPTPTSVYLETPPPQAVFYDTFKNNALGWSISDAHGYVRTVTYGKLTLRNTNPGTTLVESLPTNAIYANVNVSVHLTILKSNRNDSAGFYIRGDSNLDHDYRIDINGNGTIDLAKEYLDTRNNPQSIMLSGPRKISTLNPIGVQNTITIVTNGSTLQLFVNGVKGSIVTDSDYSTGQVALFARADKDSRELIVTFSRVEVDTH
jgi:hypothetical protein